MLCIYGVSCALKPHNLPAYIKWLVLVETGRLSARALRSKRTLSMPKTTSLFGGIRDALGGGSKAGSTLAEVSFSDNAPSWELLSEMVAAQRLELGAPEPDKITGPTNAQALRRTFGQPGEPRVKVIPFTSRRPLMFCAATERNCKARLCIISLREGIDVPKQ
eukprot:3222600-Pyramimonas_sp.AAC.1